MAARRGSKRESPKRESPKGKGLASGDEPTEGGGPLTALPELMRKAFAAGFSGFFLTEEAVRKALGETLPRDWSDFAVDQSNRTRAEFLERLSYEIGRSLENIDVAEVLAQLLEGRTLEVKAQIRLGPKDPSSGSRRVRVDVEGDEGP